MKKISLCMIIKDEESVLDRCLNSIKNIVDEIIIVDTGSKDKSKEIAKKYTDKIFDFEWCDDFSKARNYSFSKATCEYIMWLDADDIVPPSTQKFLKELKNKMTSDTYMLQYKLLNKENKTELVFYRERILKNTSHCKWLGAVHECITPFGKIEKIPYAIEHKKIKTSDPRRNIKIYNKLLKIRELNPRETYYYARELFDNRKYYKSIYNFKKFINSNLGWIENVVDAHYMIALSYVQINQPIKALEYLFNSLKLTKPRPQICCLIADIFLSLYEYELSIYWYKLAITNKNNDPELIFTNPTYNNYYPHLQLCLAYYQLGNIVKAIKHNELAGRYNKHSKPVQYNREFFNSLIPKK